jgi:hypothetical protein
MLKTQQLSVTSLKCINMWIDYCYYLVLVSFVYGFGFTNMSALFSFNAQELE